jgi:hypothetical protein
MKPLCLAIFVGLLGMLSAAGPARADGPQGLFEVCRPPGLATVYDRQSIPLSAGTTFADTSDLRTHSTAEPSDRPVRVMLLEPVIIPAAARCAVGRAAVTMNPRGFPIGPGEHRAYRFSGNFHGPAPELQGQARTDFH